MSNPTSEHPSDADLVALIEGQQGVAEHHRAHLAGCAECLTVVAELARLEGSEGREVKAAAGPQRVPGPGSRLGRYTLETRVGEGAMGVVYAAHDPLLERTVAIKVLHPHLEHGPSQLLGEARTLARLSHPNLSTLFDAGEDGGVTWLALEYLEGVTLREHLRARQLDWAQLLAVFRQAAMGLAAAHAAGVVQRDFKPDNVMVTRAGRAVVTDFGLAGSDPEAGGGTPAYMSPEQARGELADGRSDQFSFCVALYEAMLGQRPFRGATLADHRDALLSNTRQGPSAVLPAPTPRAHEALLALIDRGLALDPRARFRDMNELVAALDDVMKHEDAPAQSQTPHRVSRSAPVAGRADALR